MKETLLRTTRNYQRTFLAFTAGQKVVALVGIVSPFSRA